MDRRSKEHVIEMEIYTDGSLKRIGKNVTFGGWSFIALREKESPISKIGQEFNTTNQRMELTAIQEALKWAQKNRRPSERVVIYSDSAYIVNCYLQEWYVDWEKNRWLNASNKPVANQDLWINIIPFFDDFWYTFRKVQGHSGDVWNEKSDKLAQDAAEQLKLSFRGVKRMRDKAMYEVSRDEYKSFIEQIKPECRRVELDKLDWRLTAAKVYSVKSGRCLASRVFDHRQEVNNPEPERYYIFEIPEANESLPPIPKLKINLETREQVQAFFNAVSKHKEMSENG